MTAGINLNTSTVFAGLGTSTFTATADGLYTCAFTSTIPYITGTSGDSTVTTGGSALQVVVNVNGSPVLTVGGASDNPTPNQPSLGGSVSMNLVATDVVTVVLTSANAVDAAPNAVKTTINLFQGPS